MSIYEAYNENDIEKVRWLLQSGERFVTNWTILNNCVHRQNWKMLCMFLEENMTTLGELEEVFEFQFAYGPSFTIKLKAKDIAELIGYGG